MAVWSRLLAVVGLAALGMCVTACRDGSATSASFTEDLGTESRPLPPPPSPIMVAKIREGTAELPPLRDPTATSPEPEDGGGDGSAGTEEGAEFDAAAIEQEIRAIVEEHNEFARKFEFQELTNFFVTSQQEQLDRLNTALKKHHDALNALCAKIVEANPDSQARVDALKLKMYNPDDAIIVLTSVEVAGPKTVNVVMKTPIPTLANGTFRLLGTGEEANWYLEVQGLNETPLIETMIQGLEADVTMKPIREGFESGAIPADMALTQLEAMAEMAESMRKVLEQAGAGAGG